jgi:hypothetical protein
MQDVLCHQSSSPILQQNIRWILNEFNQQMSALPACIDTIMEQHTQGLSDMYRRHISFNAILEHGDKRMYGVSSFKSLLEFSCMCASEKHHHHPVDGADDWKRDCVGNNLGVSSMESV